MDIKIKLVGVTLIMVTIMFLGTIPVNSVNMDNWNYYCTIFIDNTNNPQKLIDYQILVKLDSNNFNFAQAQPDGDDLRFTNQKGDILPHWIEFYDSQNKEARIWVKVDSIPASDITSIVMYYGNPTAASASNGVATFVLFDDFETNTTGNYTWEHVDHGPPPGPLSTYSWDPINKWVYITTGDNSGMKVIKSVILPPHGHFFISFRKLRDYPKDNVHSFYISQDEDNYYAFIVTGSGYDPVHHPDRLRKYIGGTLVDSSGIGEPIFIDSNTDHTIEGWYTNTMIGVDIDGEPSDTLVTTNTVQITPVSFSFLSDQIDLYWYEIRVRKYTDPEPIANPGIGIMRSIWGGNFQKSSFDQMLKPLASFHISQAESLKEKVYLLLQKAIQKGFNVSEVLPLIEMGDNLFEDAKKFYSSGNYIAANNLALQAINLYAQAVEILELLMINGGE